MMPKVKIVPYNFYFKKPAGTSRGILLSKRSYFIVLEHNGEMGIGECGLIDGLSPDAETCIDKLQDVTNNIDLFINAPNSLVSYPSVRFGLETAILSLNSQTPFTLFNNTFSSGISCIPLNGLIWMGEIHDMLSQIKGKIDSGWNCLKLKIGAQNFDDELDLLSTVRKEYPSSDLEIRLDANGAFNSNAALEKIKRLSAFNIHSIEQPIAPNQWDEMADICNRAPIPVALDEELIGIYDDQKQRMLDHIRPQFIICKPSLLGGWAASTEWVELAEAIGISWWITSALESNIGLNAIAQWTAGIIDKEDPMYQGLGTGSLYTNNISSPLEVLPNQLKYNNFKTWDIDHLFK